MDNQKWPDRLRELARTNDFEVIPDANETGLLIVSPKPFPEGLESTISAIIPNDIQRKFEVGVRPTTQITLHVLLKQVGSESARFEEKDHHLKIEIFGESEKLQDETLIRAIEKILQNDGYITSYVIFINDEEMACYNQVVANRVLPEITRGITPDDILNLTIELETCTVDEFIERM